MSSRGTKKKINKLSNMKESEIYDMASKMTKEEFEKYKNMCKIHNVEKFNKIFDK